jgi:hypothetical protein
MIFTEYEWAAFHLMDDWSSGRGNGHWPEDGRSPSPPDLLNSSRPRATSRTSGSPASWRWPASRHSHRRHPRSTLMPSATL